MICGVVDLDAARAGRGGAAFALALVDLGFILSGPKALAAELCKAVAEGVTQ